MYISLYIWLHLIIFWGHIEVGSLCLRTQTFLDIWFMWACVCLVAQSCLTLVTHRLPGSTVQEILQARILEWVAISFSRGSSQPRNQTQVSSIAVRLYQLSYKESPHVSILLFKISHLSASMYQCPCSEVILGLSAFILNS